MSQKKSFAGRKKAILNQHHETVDMMRNRRYRTLLDLGCGNAYKAMVFALELDMSVVALDEFEGHGSTETFDGVLETITNMNLDQRIQVHQGNALDVKRLNQHFDVVFTQNVLHHIFPWPKSTSDDVQGFFQDVYAVINPGGMFCATDMSPWNFWDRLAHVAPGKWYQSALFSSINSVGYKSKTPASVWSRHLQNVGFGDLRLKYHVPYPFRHLRIFLDNPFANRFLESVYTITAMKPAA